MGSSSSSEDLADKKTVGIYYKINLLLWEHRPSEITSLENNSNMLIVKRNGIYIEQILIELQGAGRVWVRDKIQSELTTDNWVRVTAPSFYKNYNDLAALSQGLANGYVQVPTNSFASLQGKNYPSFIWINDGVSTPFGSNQSTIMGRCITSLSDLQYTMIDVWHIATPSIIYRGVMTNGAVSHWYQINMTQTT